MFETVVGACAALLMVGPPLFAVFDYMPCRRRECSELIVPDAVAEASAVPRSEGDDLSPAGCRGSADFIVGLIGE